MADQIDKGQATHMLPDEATSASPNSSGNNVEHELQLLEAIASEPDQQKRLAISGEIQTWVLDQAYQIPIFEEPQAFAAAPYVKGLAFEAVGRPSFYNVWLAAH